MNSAESYRPSAVPWNITYHTPKPIKQHRRLNSTENNIHGLLDGAINSALQYTVRAPAEIETRWKDCHCSCCQLFCCILLETLAHSLFCKGKAANPWNIFNQSTVFNWLITKVYSTLTRTIRGRAGSSQTLLSHAISGYSWVEKSLPISIKI